MGLVESSHCGSIELHPIQEESLKILNKIFIIHKKNKNRMKNVLNVYIFMIHLILMHFLVFMLDLEFMIQGLKTKHTR